MGVGVLLSIQPCAQHWVSFHITLSTLSVLCSVLDCKTVLNCKFYQSACLFIGTNLFHYLPIGRIMTTLHYFAVNKIMAAFYGYLAILFCFKMSQTFVHCCFLLYVLHNCNYCLTEISCKIRSLEGVIGQID